MAETASINNGEWTIVEESEKERFKDYIRAFTKGKTPDPMIEAWVEECARNTEYADKYGMTYEVVEQALAGAIPEYFFLDDNAYEGSCKLSSVDGFGMLSFHELDAQREALGVEVLFDCHDERLIQNPQTKEIVGAYTMIGNEEKTVKARKAVIMTLGGFEFNEDRMGGDIFLPGSQPFLHVNVNGERFMNEDQCYPMSYAAGANQPKHYSWIVWDGNYWDDIAQFDTCGCSRLYPAPSGTAFNADVYDCEAMSKEHLDEFWLNPRLEAGTLKKADTLEALADMMEFDADQKATFLATVERYNGLVAAGEDTDFGKPAYRLSDVETAPFYAARIGGELLVTIHGVITDVNSRPLKNDGTPIEGLYALGNVMGDICAVDYPINVAGNSHGRCITYGYLLGHELAGA